MLHGFRLVREGSVAPAPIGADAIRTPRDVVAIVEPLWGNDDVETFGILALDVQLRLLGGPIALTRGLLDATLVHPREVFRAALTLQAGGPSALVLTHNHPSGDPTPSEADKEITAVLVAAGRVLDIPVLDHVIVARGGQGAYTSFAEAGLLDLQGDEGSASVKSP